MIFNILFGISSLVAEVDSDPSVLEVQEVIFEEDISDTPEEEEDLDEEEPE